MARFCQGVIRLVVMAVIAAMILPFPLSAATVTDVYDQPSTTIANTASNHKITVTTTSAFAEGETLALAFASDFNTALITEDDVDISDDGVDLTTAANCLGAEQASVEVALDVITIALCAGDGGAIAAGSVVVIEVGTNAASSGAGVNRISNPAIVGTYGISLGGTYGDSGAMWLAILSDDNAGISFTVPVVVDDEEGGGGGGDEPGGEDPGGEDVDGGGDVDGGDEVTDGDPVDDAPIGDDGSVDDGNVLDDGDGVIDEESGSPSGESSDGGSSAGDVAGGGSSTGGGPMSGDSDGGGGVDGGDPQIEEGKIDVIEEEGTEELPTTDDEDEATVNEDEGDRGGAVRPADDQEPEDAGRPVSAPTVSSFAPIAKAIASFVPVQVALAASQVEMAVREAIIEVRAVPEVQRAVDIAVPVTAAAAVASTATLVTSFSLLPYLQYLITSPLLLFWRRKRKNFGIVYNAMTKMSVDLATVRIYDAATNRLLRSSVTDAEGKYYFAVNPGSYRLAVVKPGFEFPSAYLAGVKDDGAYLDVYTGQDIEVTAESATVAANIPMDPKEKSAQAARTLSFKRILRQMQYVAAISGIVLSSAVYVLRPSPFALVMIFVQVAVFLLVRRLARPRRAKGWGIVYDASSRKPVSNAIVRLFEPKYNKLVETTLTDNLGRYAFVLGPNEYFASYAKKGYKEAIVRPIDYREKREPTAVTVDVPLEREGAV